MEIEFSIPPSFQGFDVLGLLTAICVVEPSEAQLADIVLNFDVCLDGPSNA